MRPALEALLEKAATQSEQSEVFEVTVESVPVQFEANRLKTILSRQSHSTALRLIKAGRIGFAITTGEDLGGLLDMSLETAPFGQVAGFELQGKLAYAPVGALRDRIYAGEPADLTIVTPVIIEQLQARGLVRSATRTDLGRVGGGIAVRKGAPHPAIGTPEELKRALLAAKEIYYADPKIATAGAHFFKVVDRLGIGEEVRKKGRTAGSGKVSMELMARSTVEAIGLTQISEILSVPEVELVGPYPGDLQLMTTYTGILLERTPHPAAAEAFLRFLTSPPVQARFKQQGYELPVR
jgi:molybdate transport system substrate-binding protein